ncbi:MAG: lycopene beta-cyclase CrtY, partial [Caulobacteraceae bacterium]
MAEPSQSDATRADALIVGGGLASGLIALRLKAARPASRVVVLERERRIGGEHTWCCFDTDVSPSIWTWLSPLVERRWDGYEVRFPRHRRALSTAYSAITSAKLAAAVEAALSEDAWTSVEAAEVGADRVRLADGRRLVAPLVIDARGARRSQSLALAWQKFLGIEVRLERPHELSRPIVMDATVDQIDGYRFLYVLP